MEKSLTRRRGGAKDGVGLANGAQNSASRTAGSMRLCERKMGKNAGEELRN